MLAFRSKDAAPSLKLASEHRERASIGSRRNPESTRAILDAAESILREEGLAGLSMDAIARRARCGKPTLYRWWPEKASLLAEIHERALASVGREVFESIEQLTASWDATWRTTLAGIALRGMVAEAQTSADAMRILHERGLEPYRTDLRACDDVLDHQSLDALLAPMVGRLLLRCDSSPPPRRATSVMRAAHPAPTRTPTPPKSRGSIAETGIVHRGEWVD